MSEAVREPEEQGRQGGRRPSQMGRSDTVSKRGLEYGVRAPVFYGNLREQTRENGFPLKPAGVLFCYFYISESLRKPPGVHGRT